ncbi:hypothetical protein H5410_053140 [Solanum commersonii]|uniref:DUF4371 domain-containing protein n=1 Tax=Solanum commersonii TaxID=4109 RepID=A0A9J5X2Q1_SOLCO|nr:hypothetical protein H5410_053140 [Solanum commersonii]
MQRQEVLRLPQKARQYLIYRTTIKNRKGITDNISDLRQMLNRENSVAAQTITSSDNLKGGTSSSFMSLIIFPVTLFNTLLPSLINILFSAHIQSLYGIRALHALMSTINFFFSTSRRSATMTNHNGNNNGNNPRVVNADNTTDESINQEGSDVFSTIWFTSWNKKRNLDVHSGKPNSVHNQSRRNCEDLLRQRQSIQSAFSKQCLII